MNANSLCINLSKTNFKNFSPQSRCLNNSINSLSVGSNEIKRATSIKYLGMLIDDNLNWKEHIKSIQEKLTKYCGLFYKIRSDIPKPILKNIYFALIHSTLQYGIEIYANTKKSYLNDLQILNNRILRILQFKNIITKIIELYSTYNTLPITHLHDYKLSLLAFKFLYHPHILPYSFCNYSTLNLTIHSHFTRTYSNIHITSCRKQLGKRAISHKAAALWNNLPTKLKSPNSIKTFKKNMYNYFLD